MIVKHMAVKNQLPAGMHKMLFLAEYVFSKNIPDVAKQSLN